MRRSQKILLGIFFTGVLLCGVGTGVAIGEYASMTYLGERELGEDLRETKSIDYTFDPSLGVLQVRTPYFGYRWENQAELEEDPAVPENTVRFEVTYIPETMDLFVREELELIDDIKRQPQNEPQVQGYIWLDWQHYDATKLLIREKDRIIADLKNHSFASYRTNPLEKVVIKVNPATAEFVRLEE